MWQAWTIGKVLQCSQSPRVCTIAVRGSSATATLDQRVTKSLLETAFGSQSPSAIWVLHTPRKGWNTANTHQIHCRFKKKPLEILTDLPLMTKQEFVTTAVRDHVAAYLSGWGISTDKNPSCNLCSLIRMTLCREGARGDMQHTGRQNTCKYFVSQRRNSHSSIVTSHLKIFRLGFGPAHHSWEVNDTN